MAGAEYEDVIPALNLFAETQKLNIPGACVGISTKALGGNVELSDIMLLEDNNFFPADIRSFAPAKGLNIGTWFEIPEKVDVDLLRAYLSDKGFDEDVPNKNFTGHFFVYDDGNVYEPSPSNHCIAIPARHKLSRDMRKKLKNSDSWLLIDTTTTSGWTISTTKSLADRIDEINKAGMEVMVAKAFLRK
jgi:hypothetical protein